MTTRRRDRYPVSKHRLPAGDVREETATAGAATALRTEAEPGRLTHHDVMSLQRLAGNAAVTRLLTARRAPAPAVQRKSGSPAGSTPPAPVTVAATVDPEFAPLTTAEVTSLRAKIPPEQIAFWKRLYGDPEKGIRKTLTAKALRKQQQMRWDSQQAMLAKRQVGPGGGRPRAGAVSGGRPPGGARRRPMTPEQIAELKAKYGPGAYGGIAGRSGARIDAKLPPAGRDIMIRAKAGQPITPWGELPEIKLRDRNIERAQKRREKKLAEVRASIAAQQKRLEELRLRAKKLRGARSVRQ